MPDAATVALDMFQNRDHTLCQQLLGAVKDNLVPVLYRSQLGYIRYTTVDMLIHLYKTYMVITNTNWIENDKRSREAYDPIESIKLVWLQIDNTVAYANAGSTSYYNKQVVDNTYQIVFNTGVFTADCWEWNKRKEEDKNLPQLEVIFAAAHMEWCILLQNETGVP